MLFLKQRTAKLGSGIQNGLLGKTSPENTAEVTNLLQCPLYLALAEMLTWSKSGNT